MHEKILPSGAQERRSAKLKLPAWLRFLEIFLWLSFWLVSVIFVVPYFVKNYSENLTLFDGIEILLIMFTLLPIAMLLCNIALWLIPLTQKISDKNAKGIPGSSFQEANKGLVKFATVMVGLFLIDLIFRHLF